MSTPVAPIQALERTFRREITEFRAGDKVKVYYLIREGEKERVQVFQGVVIRKRGGGAGASFTVRKVSFGVGVERIFPLHSPRIQKLEVLARGHVRRGKLYFLRGLRGKKARLRESLRQLGGVREAPPVREQPAPEPTPAAAPAESTDEPKAEAAPASPEASA